jgi:hypothetical protein
MIDNRTMVDRPNRRPFLGVAYGLRAGVIRWQACPPRPDARRTQRHRSSRARGRSVYTRRVHRRAPGPSGPIIKTAKHLQSAEGPRMLAAGRVGRRRTSLRSTAGAHRLGRLRRRVRVRRRATGVRLIGWWCVETFHVRPASPGSSGMGGQKIVTGRNVSLVFLSTRCTSVI